MRYRLFADVVHKARGPWHLFFHPQTLGWAVTDEAGAWVLEALRSSRTVAQVARKIAAQTGCGLPEVSAEVSRFIRSVTGAGLAEVVGRPRSCANGERPKGEEAPRPGSLYLHLTERCNLTCVYCYARPQRSRDYGTGKDLPFAVAKQALGEAKALGVKTVIVTGGEPLLHPRALDVLEEAKGHGFTVILLTNGLLVNNELARRLSACCDQVTVSLDSASSELHDLHRGRGTHARVTEAIGLLKAAGVQEVVAAGVVTRHNQHEPYADFAGYAQKVGADRASRQVYILQGDRRDEVLCPDFKTLLRRWEQELEDTIVRGLGTVKRDSLAWRDRCGAAHGVIALGADGVVYPCQGLMRGEFAAGNIGDALLEEIYAKAEVLNQVQAITVADISACVDCEYRFICGGGCRALAYNVHRSIAAPIPPEYCAFARLLAEWKLWAAALHGLASPCSTGLSL